MEVFEKQEGENECHLTSAAAFVEGGIQDACDDSCSICLEAFCDSDPGTVTVCKHEFHLQCILEWCQRSSNCPMCWQAITLKDLASQELLEAVEKERLSRFKPAGTFTIFHHPTLRDIELQHLPVGVNPSELKDRIIQHLAAAAAIGRTHHMSQGDGSRNGLTAHGQPQFLVFSAHPNVPSSVTEPTVVTVPSPLRVEAGQPRSTSDTTNVSNNHQGTSVMHRSSSSQSSLPDEGRASPSEFQTVTSSWKSRFNAISIRYMESLSKSTRVLKERLFNKSPTISNIDSEAHENNRQYDDAYSNLGDDIHHETTSNDNNTHDAVQSAASN